jgi:hypothetical protein
MYLPRHISCKVYGGGDDLEVMKSRAVPYKVCTRLLLFYA